MERNRGEGEGETPSFKGGVKNCYSVKEVARVFNLTQSRLRYWAQTGFLNPSVRKGTRIYYTFTDLIGVKAAKDLLDSGLSLQKVRKNLAELRNILPGEDRPLSRLRIRSDGEHVVILGEDATFEVESQQTLLDFSTGSLKNDVDMLLSVSRPVVGSPAPTKEKGRSKETAYRLFVQGLAHENKKGEGHEAAKAFRRALDLDPSLSAAHTNLGNIYYRMGQVADARAHYERALALDPDQPEARYNLANIYDDEGDVEMAIAEYRRVLASCPDFRDAHFNLGLAFEKLGRTARAKECFERYLEFEPDSDSVWAKLARTHVDFLKEET